MAQARNPTTPCWKRSESSRSDRLAARGEDPTDRERHAAWYLKLAEASEPFMEGYGGEQALWIARLDRELGNIRAAAAWFHQIADVRRLVRLVTVLDTYWFLRPYHAEVDRWLSTGLHAHDLPANVRAAALHLALSCAYYQGNIAKAMGYAEKSLTNAETWGDTFAIGRAHYSLGRLWEHAGYVERAAAFHREAVQRFRLAGAASWIYLALAELGSALLLAGDTEGATPLVEEALALVRTTDEGDPMALQDTYGLAEVLGARGYAARARGDLRLATQLFAEKYALGQELSASREALGALAGLAAVALDRGQPARAARLLGAVDTAREAEGLAFIAQFPHVKRLELAISGTLGQGVDTVHRREGQLLPFEDAVGDALALLDEVDRPL